MAPKLILTGFMATGKSTVARALARRLGWPLVECDAMIVARAGKPIPEIFEAGGEASFRALEREVIAAIARDRRRCARCGQPRPAVISTGGGALADRGNQALLAACGVIICLDARPEVIARRIGRGANSRPMLLEGGKPLRARIAELMEARREAYSCASITVDTSDLSIEQVVDAVIAQAAIYRAQRWIAST
ncbi:MAG: shikimate kinase [Candidatus Binataceae bacterium]